MNTAVATQDTMAQKIDAALFRGDLSKLSDEERVVHVHNVCKTLGLNPATGPLAYITLNGKLTLYAKRDACDQLRKIHGINIEIASTTVQDGLLTVHARAIDRDGRRDEDFGVVSVAGLKGEQAANAFLKAITKAKRRVTLSIAGLGFSDETEVDEAQPFQHLTRDSLPPNKINPALSQPEREKLVDAQSTDNMSEDRVPAADLPSEAERAATEPCEIGRGDDSASTWSTWATLLMGYIRAAPDADTINKWTTENAAHLQALQEHDSGKHARLIAMIAHQIAARAEQGS